MNAAEMLKAHPWLGELYATTLRMRDREGGGRWGRERTGAERLEEGRDGVYKLEEGYDTRA